MTHDVVALVPDAPTGTVILECVAAVAPALHIAATPDGNAVQLFDTERGLVATIENPVHVRAPGEATRLLAVEDPPDLPFWWLEIRSPVFADANEIAVAIAHALTARLGGVVWRTADFT